MEEETSGAGRIIGTMSKMAGTSVGTAAAAGRRVLRFVKGGPLEELVRVEEPRVSSSESALDTEQQKKLKDQIVALQAELAAAGKEARREQSEFAARLEELQEQKRSLLSSLEGTRQELKGARDREGALRARVDALELELPVAREEAQREQSDLASRLEDLQAENRSLLSSLEEARQEAEDSKDREGALRARVDALESELAEAPRAEGWQAVPRQQGPREPVPAEPETEPAAGEPAVAPEVTGPPAVPRQDLDDASFPTDEARLLFENALSDLGDESDEVRRKGAAAMGEVPVALSVRVLTHQFRHERSARVREKCVDALASLEKEEGLPAVEDALEDPAAAVRLAAVRGVYRLRGAEAAPLLAGRFFDPNEDVRSRAVTYMGWLGQKELAVKLLRPLNDESASVRRAAATAAKNLASPRIVSALIRHLDDTDESVCRAVLDAIEAITGEKKSEGLPAEQSVRQRVIEHWQEWWDAQAPA